MRREPLVAVVVRRHDDQPLAEIRDRAGIVVAEGLVDQDGRLADVLPVDLVVVDAPERRDQVAERLSDHADPPAATASRHLVGPHRHPLER